MKSVELFSGIGGFRIACDELGIDTVWANDIDDNAAKVYMDNFPGTNYFNGDINSYISEIPDHDLLTGGFPCQPFSSAGKKLGINDVRGTLFSSIVEIIKNKNPNFFVLENVKRLLSMDNGLHFSTILNALSSAGYFVEWRLLNAIDFGLPQNRERVIIIGWRSDFGKEKYPRMLPQKDIENISYKQSENIRNFSTWTNFEDHRLKFKSWGCAYQGKFIDLDVKRFTMALPFKRLFEVLEECPSENFFFNEDTIKRIKDSIKVNKYFNGVEIKYNQKGGARMGYSIFGVNGVAPTLTSSTSRHYERYEVDGYYRRLTNIEYARIQGFPDNHCRCVSVYDQYVLFGNAVPPILVKWAINQLINNENK
ncbi:DNA cytosine methyltransferase [Pectobacterium brasiliense]|uniref:DNA cytosine methyltransferase n=1 Tax=Pectobacterium brasiliense TaxID=180957 RepID=UPI002A800611|nr:DNA cytosine methyltransferase [Pectobacterium brasiliense]MDY4369952.1 DNA cytosine methyltransferase [Pectobacterium brasiliense]MDY7059484.1 DNA cytosine methyltransferase [Pectobacterium brasiliense]